MKVKIIYKDGGYLIRDEIYLWEYQNDPYYLEYKEATEEEIDDWNKNIGVHTGNYQ